MHFMHVSFPLPMHRLPRIPFLVALEGTTAQVPLTVDNFSFVYAMGLFQKDLPLPPRVLLPFYLLVFGFIRVSLEWHLYSIKDNVS